jgi:hypothetical protein
MEDQDLGLGCSSGATRRRNCSPVEWLLSKLAVIVEALKSELIKGTK